MKNIQNFNTAINDLLLDSLKKEQDRVGYYNLPHDDIDYIREYAKKITKKSIVIVGIGGSSLGTYAIYQFLKAKNSFDKELYFLESTDPVLLNNSIKKLDLDDTLFIVVSKSGTTLETISIFKYICSIVKIDRDNLIVVTDKESKLEQFAIKNSLDYFTIPSNVGGRFSVLSTVGLLPLAIIGVDIQELLNGAKSTKDRFFDSGDGFRDALLQKATFYSRNMSKYNINCIFSYSELLRGFNSWYIQLWGESLGKQQIHSALNVGLTPIGLIGPTDQHSFLQLIVDGKRDKSVTFIKIKDFETDLKVPDVSLESLEELDIINNMNFSDLINLQADSIIESLESLGDIPLDVIELDRVDEQSIGKLIYYYELLTSLVAVMLDINAYDQPGVEDGKIILKNKLKSR
jgi:glucose-6-phosphate isomerase